MADGLSHIGIFPIFPTPCSPGLVVSVLFGRNSGSQRASPLERDGFEPSVPGHEPVRGGTGLKSRKWERISLRNCGTERSKSISVQRPVSCEREYLDQGRSGPSDIGAEKAARLDPGRIAPGLAGLRVGAF